MFVADEIGGVKDGDKLIEKYRKSLKTRKLSKSQKSAKSRKKLSKSGNSSSFNTKKNGLSFLIPNAKIAFNHLRLAFTKAPILWHFDPKWYIWIKINASSYAIGDVLTQLVSETRSDRIITKTDLG